MDRIAFALVRFGDWLDHPVWTGRLYRAGCWFLP